MKQLVSTYYDLDAASCFYSCQVRPSIVISESDWSSGYLAASYLRSHWLMSWETALPTHTPLHTNYHDLPFLLKKG